MEIKSMNNKIEKIDKFKEIQRKCKNKQANYYVKNIIEIKEK